MFQDFISLSGPLMSYPLLLPFSGLFQVLPRIYLFLYVCCHFNGNLEYREGIVGPVPHPELRSSIAILEAI